MGKDEHSGTDPSPPADWSRPRQALWWLKQGRFTLGAGWAEAHRLCQMDEGEPDHDMVHALAHWIEGDIANRDYWYRRIGQTRAASIEAEWERMDKILKGRGT